MQNYIIHDFFFFNSLYLYFFIQVTRHVYRFSQPVVAVRPTVPEGSTKPARRQGRVKLCNRMNGYCGEQHLITQRRQ